MNRIAVKLALFFLVIVVVSTVVAVTAVTLLSHQVADEVALHQLQIARAIRALQDRTDLTLEDIVSIVATSQFTVRRIEVIDAATIGPADLARLEADEIVRVGRGRLQGDTTVLRFGDAYVAIGLEPQSNVAQIWLARLWNPIVLYVAISAGLILTLTNRLVHPVLELTGATQEVAKGNFEVQIEIQRNDEIGHLTENFNHMVRRLRTIEYLRKDFISNVSHEFKTPLTAIQGFAKLIADERTPDTDRAEYAGIIAREAARLAAMSSTMLSLSKLENQQSVDEQTEFALDEQLRRAIVLLEPHWAKKRIGFNVELEASTIVGNEDLLQQVWLNLLGNAIKFTPDGGHVEVTLRASAQSVEVRVRDSGIGIAADDLPRIFEKFFQVDRSRGSEGNGLGLSLVKRIVTLAGGEITAESRPNQGSEFVVSLPTGGARQGSAS